MKISLILILLVCSLSAFSSSLSIECVQDEGDNRFDLIFSKNDMAIIHTNDNDESELIYYDYAEVNRNSDERRTISGGRYIVNLESRDNGYFIASLFKLEGREKVQLGSKLDCFDDFKMDTDAWIREYLK